MRKGIKILVSFVSAAVLALIVLPVVFSLLLHLPSVQQFAVRRAARYLSERLETTVTVDGVRFQLFNRLTLDGLYAEDYARDTLLYVRSLNVEVSQFGILSDRFLFGRIELEDPVLNLVQDSTGRTNLSRVLDKIRAGDSGFRLRTGSLSVRGMTFRYRAWQPVPRDGGVNFADLTLERIDLEARRVAIIDDSVSLSIRRLSLAERSGFRLDELAAESVAAGPSGIRFEELKIITPDSKLSFDHLYLAKEPGQGYREFARNVTLDASIRDSRLALRTLGYFVPALRGRETVFERLTMEVQGPVSDLKGTVKRLDAGDSRLAMRFSADGLPDVRHTRFTVDMERLNIHAEDLDALLADVTGSPLSPQSRVVFGRIGEAGVSGRFDGTLSDFSAQAAVETPLGKAGLNLGFFPGADGNTAFRGDVQVSGFDLGALLKSETLGSATLQAAVDGAFTAGGVAMEADVNLASLGLNDYQYRDVTMRGRFENRMFQGEIHSGDPDIRFDFDGRLDFNDSLPRYDFDLRLHRADLRRLKLNRRDSVSVVQGRLVARGSGDRLDNLNAAARISDLLYVNHIDSVRTGDIRVTAENDPQSKYIGFASSFADAEFRGRHSYGRIFDYLNHTLRHYLPGLSDGRRNGVPPASSAHGRADIDGYYLLKLNVKEANNVAGIFAPGLQLAEGTRLSFLLNPHTEQFSLTLESEFIEQGRFFASNLNLNSRNEGDSLSIHLSSDDLYAAGLHLPNLSVVGGVRDNRIGLTSRFSDPDKEASALIGIVSRLERDTATRSPRMRLRFTPSSYTADGRTWRIVSRDVVIDSARVAVDRFRIVSDGQELRVDGAVSRRQGDTLRVALTNFDIGPVTQFTSRAGYAIRGMSNGRADLISAPDGGRFEARLRFDSVYFNGVRVPSSLFESRWDFAAERARFTLYNTEGRDTVMVGYYRPADRRYRADFTLRRMDLSLLDPQLDRILHDTKGEATAQLTVTGTRRWPKVNGTIRVPSLTTTVDYLNVPYTLRNAEIAFEDNVLNVKPTELSDPSGNRGAFEMTLDLNHLRNLVYDIRIRAEDMLLLNTTERENDLFSGRVFGSGTATIRGSKRGTVMNVSASTSDHSTFFMSLGGASSIAQADFVVFESAKEKKTEQLTPLEQRKLRFQRHRRQRFAGGGMRINMALDVRPNTEFHLMFDPELGDGIRARGNAAMNLQVNPSSNEFTMYGDYQITEGNYNFVLRNIINKNFTIQPGSSIQWTGEPSNPLLDITAVYRLKASLLPLLGSDESQRAPRTVPVEVDIILGDRSLQPVISFDVRVPNVDAETQSMVRNALNTQEMMATQFFWLLAANTFYAENPEQGQNIGAMVGSATGFELLSSQLSNWISSNRYNIGIRYRPRSELTSDELELGLSTELFNSRLLLEIEGNYDFGNNPTTTANRPTGTSNLAGDFYLTWLINRGGNLRTKAFTRTIDRFDENQGLQESGIGLYYREDFNTFGDVLRNLRQRFRRKKNLPQEVPPPPQEQTTSSK